MAHNLFCILIQCYPNIAKLCQNHAALDVEQTDARSKHNSTWK